MATQHLVVDGSNIATEGRSTPSLAQLESAIEELRREMPESEVTVVVDATFAHRIDPSELARFEEASLRGEYVSPPAGAIGRGDAFLLRIAEKVDGTVLSNDSFQEFHGEHAWLFDRGRLLGATPVPGVGWIFVPRTPVRGPRSRVAVRDASKAKQRVEKAIAVATKEVEEPEQVAGAGRRRNQTITAAAPKALNDPMTFISFIAEHPLGEKLEGEVEGFTSHGATVRMGDVLGYVPLSGLGEPPPRSARSVFRRGDRRTFVITALDPFRRGIELALPGVRTVSGRPSEEMVAAEVRLAKAPKKVAAEKAPPRRRRASATGDAAAQPPAKATKRVTKAATTRRRGVVSDSEKAAPPTKKVASKRAVKQPALQAEGAASKTTRAAKKATPAAAKLVPSPRRSPKRTAESAPAKAAKKRLPAGTTATRRKAATGRPT